YSVGFNLPGTATLNSDGSIQSTNGNGDVSITPLLQTGQTTKAVNSFVSNTSSPDESPAVHYSINETGANIAFITLVTMYNGSTPPDTTATLVSAPSTTHSFVVQLTKNGVAQNVTFTPPHQVTPNKYGTVSSSGSSIAYDSKGTLYMAYYDPTSGHLFYTTRNASGGWSPVQLVDNNPDVGMNPSIAVDGHGRPGIAYYDALNGDLKYAYLDSSANSWQIQTVDSKGTVGQFPSLAFSRTNGAVISYYDKTHHSLKLAMTVTGGWSIQTIDRSADVGRYSSLSLDPSRPTASKWAISYDDTTHGSVKYAVQAGSGWTILNAGKGGGVSSLAFDSSNLPAISYYDSKQTALEIARYSAKAKTFSSSYVASAGTVGQASSLYFDKKGHATVFYTDATHARLVEAVQSGSKWIATALHSGGTSVDVARYGTSIAYLDGSADGKTTSVYFA
ncbi:MAG: hypothetical protein JO353_04875, partial [Phycisphaerae bacterium]|nr:hypothetical protein [Phycisphaerae bacterium]